MVVRVVGETRKPDFASASLLEDPDPQQLVLAWDQAKKARATREAKKSARGAKAPADKGTRPSSAKKPAAPAAKTTAKEESAARGPANATPTAASSKRGSTSAAPPKTASTGKPAATTRGKSARKPAGTTLTPTLSHGERENRGVSKSEKEKAVGGSAGPGGSERSAKADRPSPSQGETEGKGLSQREKAGLAVRERKDGKISHGVGEPTQPAGLFDETAQTTQPESRKPSRAPRTQHPTPNTQHPIQSSKKVSYTGEQIQILEGVQHIRQRPGMYIGTTSTSGLLHLVYEAIDNVVDEFNAGYGSQMWITIDPDSRVTVRDEARGIPIDLKEWGGTVLPTATWIFIKPFTGGKFEAGAYKQAGGLHGVGLTVINALSAELEVDIWRDGQHFHQLFREGQALDYSLRPCDPGLHGTQIRWLPDPGIFDEDATYDAETLISRLEATACLNRGLWIELSYWDEEMDKQVRRVLHSQNGLADYVKQLAPAGAASLLKQPISIVKARDEVTVEVVLQPDSGYKTQILSFANGVRTPDGGTHETGFKAALTKVINDYALKLGVIKDRGKESLKPEVIQQGLSAIVSVKLADPQFQGQTKNRLNNAPVEGAARSIVIEGLVEWFESSNGQGKEWIKKIHLAQKARNEAQMAEELARTGQKKGGDLIDVSLSKKFAACNGNDPSKNELFLVEGDSAGGSAKQARRSEFQAILALKGKPLNVANATLQRIIDNEEIRTIISVVGTGTRHMFDIEKLKFHKVIILSDADVDGSHIVCLLLTLFHQEMPGLIENGHVYLGCPPLYSVKYKGKTVWLTDDEARKQFLKQRPDAKGLEFKRYKGLGEMNSSELRETTMDPSRRVLKRVTLEDSALASRLVNDLMARENAEARRALLARQAKHLAAGNLDV